MGKPTDFLLNTDYEMDKIIYFTSGSVDPTGTIKVDDNKFRFIPLLFGVFSFHEDFSDTISNGTAKNDYSCSLTATATGIYVMYRNDNNKKLYYRIYAFMPTDGGGNIGSTQKDAKQFILNTDYNYCKLYKKGTVAGGETLTVNHDFGYTPLVMTWYSGNGGLVPQTYNTNNDPDLPSCQVTDKYVKLRNYDGATRPLHYRIYYDEV